MKDFHGEKDRSLFGTLSTTTPWNRREKKQKIREKKMKKNK